MLKRATVIALFAICMVLPASAQSTFTSSLLMSYDDATGKILQLAEAFSDAQYAWRPSEGVRSVREAALHVASANFFFGSMLGAALPEGIDPGELESAVQTKEETINVLKQSIDFARKAVDKLPAASFDEEMEFFGNKAPRSRFVLILQEHAHEHLGQLIAYARSNGVVPPWSS